MSKNILEMNFLKNWIQKVILRCLASSVTVLTLYFRLGLSDSEFIIKNMEIFSL